VSSRRCAARCNPAFKVVVPTRIQTPSVLKLSRMPLRLRSRPLAEFIEPCLPRPADRPPMGGDWLHEIKHDGFRIMARREGAGAPVPRSNCVPPAQLLQPPAGKSCGLNWKMFLNTVRKDETGRR
jgi:hypothetical protein